MGTQLTGSGLEVTRLVRLAELFAGQALAPTTRRSYSSAQRRYQEFCRSHANVTQSTLCLFVAYLAAQGVAHKSIKSYLSGIRFLKERMALIPR